VALLAGFRILQGVIPRSLDSHFVVRKASDGGVAVGACQPAGTVDGGFPGGQVDVKFRTSPLSSLRVILACWWQPMQAALSAGVPVCGRTVAGLSARAEPVKAARQPPGTERPPASALTIDLIWFLNGEFLSFLRLLSS